MADMEGKWYGLEESEKPKLVKGVPRLGNNLEALGRLTKVSKPTKGQIRTGIQAVFYLMGDTIGFGFGSILWGQGRLSSESGEFCPLCQGSLSIFR